MPRSRRERRWRRALFEAVLPAPQGGLPAMAEIDLERFWPRFDGVAPAHLRLGLRVATVALGALLPLAAGHRRTLDRLDPAVRDRMLRRAERLPLLRELLEVVKIVACLAYFDDDRVQRRVRDGGTP